MRQCRRSHRTNEPRRCRRRQVSWPGCPSCDCIAAIRCELQEAARCVFVIAETYWRIEAEMVFTSAPRSAGTCWGDEACGDA